MKPVYCPHCRGTLDDHYPYCEVIINELLHDLDRAVDLGESYREELVERRASSKEVGK